RLELQYGYPGALGSTEKHVLALAEVASNPRQQRVPSNSVGGQAIEDLSQRLLLGGHFVKGYVAGLMIASEVRPDVGWHAERRCVAFQFNPRTVGNEVVVAVCGQHFKMRLLVHPGVGLDAELPRVNQAASHRAPELQLPLTGQPIDGLG